MTAVVPSTVCDQAGAPVSIRRAWPKPGRRLTFEAVDEYGRLRAGTIDDGGKATVARFRTDPALPGLGEAGGKLLVHRYKRRAVLRSEDGACYTKLLAPGKAATVAGQSALMHKAGARAGFAVPEVMRSGPDRVVSTALAGTSLHELGGADASGTWDRAWQLWAERWPSLVRDGAGAQELPLHDGTAEADTVRKWVAHLLDFQALEADPAAVRSLADEVCGALAEGSGRGEAGLAHRDLHDKQLLCCADAGTLGLLDFDTAALAEPALDLANLAVHLRLRADQGTVTTLARKTAEAAVDAAAADLSVTARRLHLYTVATELRLVCVYAFRPQWQHLAQSWLDRLLAPQVRKGIS
ncbi:phosphotransferase family protein [Crystallibacter degradans]|uniref:phosphotransferase family protein n=1 Tax=Crystallibacter degradans TaxID=2726743 RepID=UPI00147534AC|nr:phosphotransferase [Arthrobacter sp. SF27]NMR29518.1 phosphotransferase [Arthrobacter sp. SF27]